MQTFTKTEITWISGILRDAGEAVRIDDRLNWTTPLRNLRAEQYTSLADRLDKVVRSQDKRIAVEY